MGLGLYRALLRLLPPDLREGAADEMVRLVASMRAEGRVGPAFWARLLWDTTTQATLGWWAWTRKGTIQRVEEPMTTLLADLRYAFRRIRRQPLFSGTVVLLVAVGIAGNAAVFRIVNGLFLRPLPFPEAHRLVDLDVTAPAWNLEYVGVAIPDFRAWREGAESFESMAAFDEGGANLEVDGGGSARVSYLATTHDLDDVLELDPVLGRFYTADEDRPDAPLVALLSRDFWASEFLEDPGILGRTVRLDGRSAEIIGVLPAEAEFVRDVDLWLPLREDEASSYYLTGVGRLREGVTIERARDDLLAAHRALIPERSENEVTSPTVSSLRDRYLGDYRLGSGVLLAAVGLVLLMACGNIAGLMVARSVGRSAEISVRTALGARPGRLTAQLLTESLVLAGIGALAGGTLGVWGSGLLLELQADTFPSWVDFGLDLRFLAFSALVTVGAAVLFGLLPALGSSKAAASPYASGRATASRGTRRALSWLVAAEVAAAAAMLVVAGLAVRDARQVARVDPGFVPTDLVTWRMQLDPVAFPERPDRLAFADAYLDRLRAIPGVGSASLASNLPLMGHSGWFFEVEGHERPEGEMGPVVLRRWVSPGYLEAMGLTLLQGRGLDPLDGRSEGELVVLVNETFVRTHLPDGESPLGLRIHTGGHSPTLHTIVGVVRDVKHYGLDREMRPGTYEPIAQNPRAFFQVAVRAPGDPLGVVPAARAATAELAPSVPLYDVRTMEARIDASLLSRRATTWLIATFSVVALLLAVAGLYGVISYTVSQRAGEISIRMAMGAEGRMVSRRIVRQGMGIVVLGLVVGLGGALLVAAPVSAMLVGGGATDPLVYGLVAAFLLVVSAVANWLPARRAARTDPMAALRGE